MRIKHSLLLMLLGGVLFSSVATAEMLAMLNYETVPEQQPRQEGVAIIDVDPDSGRFGQIVDQVALPNDGVAHHIFYNKTLDKAYITNLGKGAVRVMEMRQTPFEVKNVDVSMCQVGEDIVFSGDGNRWYLTCMGSSNVIIGDAHTDKVVKVITSEDQQHLIQNPHGISLNESIDRLLITSTISPDMTNPGATVTEIQASTGKIVATHKVSAPDFQGGSSPVEIVFIPDAKPAQAYVNTMFEGKLWLAIWQDDTKQFQFKPVFNFTDVQQGVPLEIYFSRDHKKLYVSTAKPGALNIFDISVSPEQPRLLKSIPTAAGAHHVVTSPDEHFAFVQNNFLNLPEMNDGSISVVDMRKMEKVASINTLKDKGWKANSILMMPQWHTDDAH